MKQVALTLIAALMLGLVTAGTAAAQKQKLGTVSGCLTDSETGQPIVDAWVAILENNRGARTDSAGCFTISDLPAGVYNLVVTHERYGSVKGLVELTVSVKPGESAQVKVLLVAPGKVSDKAPEPTSDALDKVADYLGLSGDKKQRQETATGELPAILAPGILRQSNEGEVGRSGEYADRSKCVPPPGYYPIPDDYSRPPRDMFFRDYGTNDFIDTRRDRFSTFAVDVDDASYNVARRYLLDGLVPPPDAIRVEEFINHFDYGYNAPSDETFRVFTELTNSPFERDRHIMKVAIKGREIERYERRPMNLTLVIDVSGSMAQGNRFGLVRESIQALVKQLNGHDRVGIVAYGSHAYVVLEPIGADRHWDIMAAMNRLGPGGSTYAEAGIRLGYEMANRQFVNGHNNVVVLCSDGVANVGRTSPDEIMGEVQRFARRGITMSTFGYGMGNYNDVLLEQLAQKGNGRYAYINDQGDIRTAFVDEFVTNLQVLARDVKVQVEFDPKVVKAYRLLGYENRDVADHRFRDNRQDGGEIGMGHEVTAVYELELAGSRRGGKIATIFVRWKNSDGTEVFELSREATISKHLASFDRARPELRLALVAGRFAEMLKRTPYAGGTSFEELYRIAEPLRRELPGEQTDDLLNLIRRAGGLTDWQAWESEDDPYFGNYKR